MNNGGGVKEHKIGIAEHKVCTPPDKLLTLGLGSCVGVVLLDRINGIGGMIHVMLPDSTQFTKVPNPYKFADMGIPLLLNELLKKGTSKHNLYAKMAGGAQMFKTSAKTSLLQIGDRNIKKCTEVLKELGIRITGEDTGGSVGRTMILDCLEKKIYVRTVGKSPVEI
ncbi:chemotaxis protein CheD [Desulfonispora thiosulfatigenes DSM 11270]|uniref:Probable chemoreceptor glutamine deamidase CheD n=1 Tax=Desulfonispora thiosulfatigenes DSM 11270 TaxID=656914 RepID=A0A1W1UM97_DESTI|nr:chemotaxis protein CheD [Desulfonispora thiosulfatigenes]SMB82265.1 chemotaxis protein CheD [Desulfonispora thiosulfatigenes DSM 11270]